MPRTRKPATERKKEILSVAHTLFSEHGYRNVIIEDIAKSCRIARSSLYEYFSNKEEILLALFEQMGDETRNVMPESAPVGCRERLALLAMTQLDYIQQNRSMYRILFQETPALSEPISSKLLSMRQKGYTQVKDVVDMGKASGEIDPEVRSEDVAFAYQALVGQRAGEFLMTNEKINPQDEAERIINILWYGVGI